MTPRVRAWVVQRDALGRVCKYGELRKACVMWCSKLNKDHVIKYISVALRQASFDHPSSRTRTPPPPCESPIVRECCEYFCV